METKFLPDSPDIQEIRNTIRVELDQSRTSFRTLLASLSEQDWRRPSLNPGWTNGEILAHMLFGFIILYALLLLVRVWGLLPKSSSRPFAWLLNAFTRPFNWFNALGARLQGRVFTCERIGGLYDRVYYSLLNRLDTIRDEEWGHGMYYPRKWDANFDEFMTVEKLFHYAVTHFVFHLGQIAR